MKVCLDTFGCRLNRAEALEEEARFIASGYEIATKHADADIIVLRGCSVTRRAQHDCEKAIEHIRRHYPTKRLIVRGCLNKSLITPASFEKDLGLLPDATNIPTRTSRAYLKVQDGCSGNCTFCIVPQFRGKSVSIPFQEVLAKARRFIDAGYHEIVVTGCNLSLYASQGKRLPELIAALAALSPDCRIRIGSVEPGVCAMELIRVMADTPNVCRFLHLPIQSGSNSVLTAMKRPYLIADVERVVKWAEKKMPRIGLGCDLMTGFPGESAFDFTATKSLLKRLPFVNAHIFPFSERPGTVAVTLRNKVPHDVRSARAHELSKLASEKHQAYKNSFVGKTVEIIVEDEGEHAGWTSEYVWCKTASALKGKTLPARKNLLQLTIRRLLNNQLVGVPA